MKISVKTSGGGYDIILKRGALTDIGQLLDLQRKVLVVTDSGVPSEYSQSVLKAAEEGFLFCVKEGESSKNMDNLKLILAELVKNNFTRTDCVVAVGGGVVGDLAGFAASTFMRGVEFYNIPTTLLSQVDSSIGGKTAVDFMGIKNIVGAFYQPKRVVIDIDTLKTLPQRQISNGLAEALKMAATCDKSLFELFETQNPFEYLDEIVQKALNIKKMVVEEDEKEKGLRRVLNFGHTLAHAVESVNGLDTFYHGECVAIGMLYFCSPQVRDRLKKVLLKLNLPTKIVGDKNDLIDAARHDKKASGDCITVVYVEKIGEFEFKKIPLTQLDEIIRKAADI